MDDSNVCCICLVAAPSGGCTATSEIVHSFGRVVFHAAPGPPPPAPRGVAAGGRGPPSAGAASAAGTRATPASAAARLRSVRILCAPAPAYLRTTSTASGTSLHSW